MNYFSKQSFENNDPYVVTQFLRGDLFIMIDAVLSINQVVTDPNDVKLIHDLFVAFIDMFVEYLKQVTFLLRDFVEGRALNQPLLYLVNPQIAVVSAFPELCDTVSKLFGGSARSKVFENATFPTVAISDCIAHRNKENYNRNPTETINLINYFGSISGFDLLLKLLSWSLETEKKGVDPEYKFPINMIYWVFRLISPANLFFTGEFKNKFFFDFKVAFFDRITMLTLKDLKDNDCLSVFNLIRDSLPLFEEYFHKDAYAICEMAELECALSILKCPFMEKRIKVLVEFKDFIERCVDYVPPPPTGNNNNNNMQ
jgi:hypothetical protein